MKIKVKRSQLEECVRNAVTRIIKEAAEKQLNEWYDEDDDEDDAVSRFVKKNPIPRAKKGEGKRARAAFLKDYKKEADDEEKDEKALKVAEDSEKSDEKE